MISRDTALRDTRPFRDFESFETPSGGLGATRFGLDEPGLVAKVPRGSMVRPGVRVESRGGFCHADRSQESTFGTAGAVPTIPKDHDNALSFFSLSTFVSLHDFP